MNKYFFVLYSVCAVVLTSCAGSGAVDVVTPTPVLNPVVAPAATPVAPSDTAPKTKKVTPKPKTQPKPACPVQQNIKKTEKVISTETIIS